jgi:O-antigen/teichoic acid export membrane protein
MNNKEYEKHDADIVKLFKIIGLAACFLILFAEQIGIILGAKSYHASLYMIPIILIGQLFIAVIPIYKRHISFVKKTYWTSVSILSASAINILLNWIFIPKYGAITGAYTTLASYFFQIIITLIIVKTVIKTHMTNPLKFLDVILIVIACCLGFYWIGTFENIWTQIGLKVLLFGITGALIYRKVLIKRVFA